MYISKITCLAKQSSHKFRLLDAFITLLITTPKMQSSAVLPWLFHKMGTYPTAKTPVSLMNMEQQLHISVTLGMS